MVEQKAQAPAPEKQVSHFEPDESISALKLMSVNADDLYEFTLQQKVKISHDSYKYVFALPDEKWQSGLFVGSHMIIYMKNAEGKEVTHKYTPTSSVAHTGTLEFIIKIYRKCEQFPEGGKLTPLLEDVQEGQIVQMEGPVGNLRYLGDGNFLLKKKPYGGRRTKLAFLTGGTGITPCYQIVQAATLAKENFSLDMIYSNKTAEDILCLEELEQLANDNPNFKLTHTLTREQKEGCLSGRINADMIKNAKFPEPSAETLVLICGSKDFNATCKAALAELGFSEEMYYAF